MYLSGPPADGPNLQYRSNWPAGWRSEFACIILAGPPAHGTLLQKMYSRPSGSQRVKINYSLDNMHIYRWILYVAFKTVSQTHHLLDAYLQILQQRLFLPVAETNKILFASHEVFNYCTILLVLYNSIECEPTRKPLKNSDEMCFVTMAM